ncbi:MAG: adenosine kinase [Oligoflexia bacterium]|nr:adenosine kinase [Oligoflexia bacterium]MBF0365674.1 adenosine kinase [Oligoflexia bacterium]
MKKYCVYGIGNALVDIEVEVRPDFFSLLGIQKGVMTLIDDKRQKEILATLNGVPLKRASGGSAANTLLTISQFGGSCFYSCKVADDEWGNFFHDDLIRGGVDTNGAQRRQKGETGRCLVMVTPDADRTMNTFLGISEQFSANELVEEAIRNSEYLYIEGYLLAQEHGRVAVQEAQQLADKYSVKKVISFSDPFVIQLFHQELEAVIDRGIDFVFCNEEEAKSYACTRDLNLACQKLEEISKCFVVTRGSQGSLLYDGERYHKVEAQSVPAVDTTGAGDIYAGSFLYGITHGMSFPAAGRLASMAAAAVVSRHGPRLAQSEAVALLKWPLRESVDLSV